jgi:hypothetical protein
MIHYDHKNQGFTRLSITKKTQLTDSIHISADYAVTLSIATPDDGIYYKYILSQLILFYL